MAPAESDKHKAATTASITDSRVATLLNWDLGELNMLGIVLDDGGFYKSKLEKIAHYINL
ncbi:MAG: hypothetical protein DRQ97_12795 [Gammaproteobacteria bacterium]|nr:MAG: hypothetical protein DRQ97_12795 [Gammaproteobacteria bacterium]